MQVLTRRSNVNLGRPTGLRATLARSHGGHIIGGDVADLRTVTVPVIVERDEDGVWCAHAQLRPGIGAHGEGDSEEEALDDLRGALVGLIEEFGVPRELSVTVAA